MKVKNKRIVELSHAVSEFFFRLKNYSWVRRAPVPTDRILVFNVDDSHMYSGGMADRFKGAVSAYAWCKCNGIGFRIRYIHPFDISDYLIPGSYDWRLREGEYSRCFRDARVLYARGERGRRLLKLDESRQIHYYGNMDVLPAINAHYGTDYRWGELYKELFSPGDAIVSQLEELKEKIGAPYVSAVFRFQNLLGDFEEYSFKSESDEERKKVMVSKCMDGIRRIQAAHPGMPVLVTSDSITFMKAASELQGVHIIPGKVVHVGSCSGAAFDTYLKSFVDFYMLSGSRKIYGLHTEEMYKSEFPMYAAKIEDIPFERMAL